MAETKIAGVMRAGAYSPNHIGNDAAIFNVVAEQLRKRGCEVNIYSEEQFIAGAAQERIIINMCREARSVALLQRLEDEGALVINSGYGIENCTRERMTRILLGSNIPYPESIIVNTDQAIRERLDSTRMSPCWIKKAESHSMHKEDVSYARHTEEAQEVLQEYFLRGIKRAVINRHLSGDLIKFYGVADSPFFYWFYPLQEAHSKYGAETINGMPANLPFSVEKLRAICAKCSEVLDVKIYGGDCIVSPEGDIRIIDFNDWPSFAPILAWLPLYLWASASVTIAATAIAIVVFTILGTWASSVSERYWGPDPVVACVDETVGQWISLLPVVAGVAPWWEIAVSLALFRFFDIVKPLGIRAMERLPRGYGMMADDILAGLYSAAILIGLNILILR